MAIDGDGMEDDTAVEDVTACATATVTEEDEEILEAEATMAIKDDDFIRPHFRTCHGNDIKALFDPTMASIR